MVMTDDHYQNVVINNQKQDILNKYQSKKYFINKLKNKELKNNKISIKLSTERRYSFIFYG